MLMLRVDEFVQPFRLINEERTIILALKSRYC